MATVASRHSTQAEECARPIAETCRILGCSRAQLAQWVGERIHRPVMLHTLMAWEKVDPPMPLDAALALRDLTREPVSALLGEMERFESLRQLEAKIFEIRALLADQDEDAAIDRLAAF